MTPVHETAAKGFERGAGDYERGRPGYPTVLLDALEAARVLDEASRVVDLGAGTGKFTALLCERVPPTAVVAVEPIAAMRAVFAVNFPEATVVDGTAEDIPLPDRSVDVVTVAQAFHWFDAVPALDEIARVLRPGGWLVLAWNTRDERAPWIRAVVEMMDRLAGDTPRFASGDGRWHGALDAHGAFGPVQSRQFEHLVPVDLETMLARVASTSYVSALPDERRAAVLADVAVLVEEGPIAEEGSTFVEPYRSRLFWCRRH